MSFPIPTDEQLREWTTNPLALIRDCFIPEGAGEPYGVVGQPWQWDLFRAVLTDRPDGRPEHKLAWHETWRGGSKTTDAAAILGADVATGPPGHRSVAVAVDQDQAALLAESVAGFSARHPLVDYLLEVQKHVIRNKRNGSEAKILAADAPSSWGQRPRLVACDEMQAWESGPGTEMWESMWSAAAKRRDGRVVALSTAGWDRTSIAWKVRELARTTPGFYFSTREGAPLPPWLDVETIEQQEKSLPPEVFRRLWRCEWSEGSGAAITYAQYDRNVNPDWRPQLAGRPGVAYFVGLDLGLTKDRTARSIVHFDRDRDQVVLDDLRVWQGSAVHPVEILEVERDLIEVSKAFHRPLILLDPWQMKASSQRLAARLRIREHTFTSATVRHLSEVLLSLLRNGQMRLFPDEALRTELLRLEVRQTGYGWRIDHASSGFSDRAMALGMACVAAVERKTSSTNIVMPDTRARSWRPEIDTSDYATTSSPLGSSGRSRWRI